MKSFKDNKGEFWDIELNIAEAMRLKSRFDIELDKVIVLDKKQELQSATVLEQICENTELLFNIIFTLCEKQVKERHLTQEDFAARFDGDAIEAATDCFLDELINFFRPAKRKILIQLRRISKEFSEKAGKELEAKLNDPEFQAQLEQEWRDSLTKSPESSVE